MHRVSDHLQDRHPYLDPGFHESYDASEVHRAFGNRAIPKYAELLGQDDLSHEHRARALAELRELLSNQETKFHAVEREILFVCADLTESPSLDVRVNAALVIASLVLHNSDHSGADELMTEAMLRAATTLLDDGDEPAVLAGCTIFRLLTVSNEGALLVASRTEIVSKITSMVNTQPLKTIAEPVVASVLAVLANVTRVFEGAQACAECAIMSPVLGVLKKCVLYSAETVHHAVLIVLNAGTHDQGKRLAIHQGGVELCLKVLARVLSYAAPLTFQKCDAALHLELTRCLVGTIMTLSTVDDAKPRIVEFGVDPLVKCLHHDARAVQRNAIVAINSACEAPRGVAAFADRLLAEKELLIDVFGAKCVPAMLRYVRMRDETATSDADTDAAIDALAVLQDLVRPVDDHGEAAAHAVVQTLHLVDAIVERALGGRDEPTEASKAVRDRAVSVLQLLVAHGDKYARRVGKTLLKYGARERDVSLVLGGAIDMASLLAK